MEVTKFFKTLNKFCPSIVRGVENVVLSLDSDNSLMWAGNPRTIIVQKLPFAGEALLAIKREKLTPLLDSKMISFNEEPKTLHFGKKKVKFDTLNYCGIVKAVRDWMSLPTQRVKVDVSEVKPLAKAISQELILYPEGFVSSGRDCSPLFKSEVKIDGLSTPYAIDSRFLFFNDGEFDILKNETTSILKVECDNILVFVAPIVLDTDWTLKSFEDRWDNLYK